METHFEELVGKWDDSYQQDDKDKCLDEVNIHRKTDTEVKAEIEALMGEPIGRLQCLDKKKRGEIINIIKQSEGVTQRQIGRVTGISQNIIFKSKT